MSHERFNIRVYGVLQRGGKVLVSHERIAGRVHAKFPGGGLEFGEGPKDAVVREFMEELGITVTVTGHGLKDPDWAIATAPAPTTIARFVAIRPVITHLLDRRTAR